MFDIKGEVRSLSRRAEVDQRAFSRMSRKFFEVRCRVRSHAGRCTLLNGDRLFPGYGRPDATPAERSDFLKPEVPFRDFPEAPVFMRDARLGPVYWDLENPAGYWFISDKMKSVLQAVDPEGLDFLQCHIRSPDGQELPARWFCNIRILDALDEERSEVEIAVANNGSKFYDFFPLWPKLVFKEPIVGSCHIFRMKYSLRRVIIYEEMRQACKSTQLKGISFSVTE